MVRHPPLCYLEMLSHFEIQVWCNLSNLSALREPKFARLSILTSILVDLLEQLQVAVTIFIK
jgi:hypothetical protein